MFVKFPNQNIIHKYYVDIQHNILYDNITYKTKPIIIDQGTLGSLDVEYNSLSNNKRHIHQRFIGDINLPDNYNIIYDPDTFSLDSSILIIDEHNIHTKFIYVGTEILNKVERDLKIHNGEIVDLAKQFRIVTRKVPKLNLTL